MERILPAYPLFVKDPNFSILCKAESIFSLQTVPRRVLALFYC